MQKNIKTLTTKPSVKSDKNKQSVINFRTKESVKRKANIIFEKMGLDMSTALNTFLYNVIIRKGLPMNLVTENGYTVEYERELLASAKDILPKEYHSIKELMRDLND